MKKINVGIIGFGMMGQRYFKILKNKKNFNISCIADTNRVALETVSKNKSIFLTNAYKTIFKFKKLDLIIISTTANLRYEIIKACVKNHIKFVICEKPLCRSVKDAYKIIRLKKKYSKISLNFLRRYSLTYKKIKNHILNKDIGDLKSITVQMGGGQFGSNGSHMIDLCRYLSNKEAKEVASYFNKSSKVNPRGTSFKDPGAYCLIKFENNIRCVIDMLDDHSSPPTIYILGSKGRIFFDERDNFYYIYRRKESDFKKPISQRLSLNKVKLKCRKINIFENTEKNIENLLSKRKVLSNLDDGLKSLEIYTAAFLSNNQNTKFIKLPINKTKHNTGFKFA